MAQLNWGDYEEPERFERMGPGRYLVEIEDASEKTSKAGDAYFNLRLKAVGFGKVLCFDVVMLAGKGRGIGYAKLKALGVTEKDEQLAAAELIGRRAYVEVESEEYDGKTRLSVSIGAEDSLCGYWDENDRPSKVIESEEGEAPF